LTTDKPGTPRTDQIEVNPFFGYDAAANQRHFHPMRSRIFTSFLLMLGTLIGAEPAATGTPPPKPKQTYPVPAAADDATWQPIFDGKSLAGWEGDPRYWRVENECIVGEVTPATLLKENTFLIWRAGVTRDFELKVEYRISERGNSGINYRSVPVPGLPFALAGYQADIDGPNRYTGQNYEERGRTFNALRGQITRIPADKKAEVIGSLGDSKELERFIRHGDWNEYHLIARGHTLIHLLNGHVMSVVVDEDPAHRRSDGLLGVQVHVGPPMKVEYRNFRLKVLE
jgi:hypothetical protein